MVSTSKIFTPNKRTLGKKPFPLAGMKHSIKNPFPLTRKTALLLRIEKIEENWFTPNFKNSVQQQKRSTRFLVNQKSAFIARMKDLLKKRFHWTEKLLPFELVSEKNEENGFH